MKSFFSRLRLKWFLATRSVNYGVDLVESLYRTYLNHNKIIHFPRWKARVLTDDTGVEQQARSKFSLEIAFSFNSKSKLS